MGALWEGRSRMGWRGVGVVAVAAVVTAACSSSSEPAGVVDEESALAVIEAAYALYNSGDAEGWTEMRDRGSSGGSDEERREVQASLAHLEEREAERERALAEVQELTAEAATLQADNTRAEADAAQIKEKIDLLEAAGEGALCPLCGHALADDDCARLLGRFRGDLETERAAWT